ncbi:MAG: hypothetical protein ACR2MO_15515 [Acidimicrobiales bacterium]
MTPKERSIAVALAVAIGLIGMLSFAMLPVKAAGGLRCEAPLKGAEPKERATEGYLVNREDKACSAKSRSRLTIVAIVGVIYIAFGISAVVLPESNIERIAFGGEDPEDVYETNN